MPSAVLVAEPEPETREYLGRQLRDDGFDVLGAARRSEALERTKQFTRRKMRRRQFWAAATVSFFYNELANKLRRKSLWGFGR